MNDPIFDGITRQIGLYTSLPILLKTDDKAKYDLYIYGISDYEIAYGEGDYGVGLYQSYIGEDFTVLPFSSIDIFENQDIEKMSLINANTKDEYDIIDYDLNYNTITVQGIITEEIFDNDEYILQNRDHIVLRSMYTTENNTKSDNLTRIRERFGFKLITYGDNQKIKASQYKRDLIRAFKQYSYSQVDGEGIITKDLIYKVDSLSFDPYVDLSNTCMVCTGSIMVEYIMC